MNLDITAIDDEASVTHTMRLGIKLCKQGNPEEALALFEEANDRKPEHPLPFTMVRNMPYYDG